MASITLDEAKAHLSAWMAADLAVASGQSYTYTLDGVTRSLTRANAAEIRSSVNYWRREVATLNGSTRRRVSFGVPTR